MNYNSHHHSLIWKNDLIEVFDSQLVLFILYHVLSSFQSSSMYLPWHFHKVCAILNHQKYYGGLRNVSLLEILVTGINLYIVTPIITIICIFYTTVGGLKAVVWTDTLQFLLMVVAIIAVITLGLLSVDGVENVWEAAERGKRLIFFK